MAARAGQTARAGELSAYSNEVNVNGPLSGIATASSTSWVNMPSGSSLQFTQLLPGSRLRITLHVTAYVTVDGTAARFGVNVDGTDWEICGCLVSAVNQHMQFSGERTIPGPGVGEFTVRGRVRRLNGGNVTIDSNDYISLTVAEIP